MEKEVVEVPCGHIVESSSEQIFENVKKSIKYLKEKYEVIGPEFVTDVKKHPYNIKWKNIYYSILIKDSRP